MNSSSTYTVYKSVLRTRLFCRSTPTTNFLPNPANWAWTENLRAMIETRALLLARSSFRPTGPRVHGPIVALGRGVNCPRRGNDTRRRSATRAPTVTGLNDPGRVVRTRASSRGEVCAWEPALRTPLALASWSSRRPIDTKTRVTTLTRWRARVRRLVTDSAIVHALVRARLRGHYVTHTRTPAAPVHRVPPRSRRTPVARRDRSPSSSSRAAKPSGDGASRVHARHHTCP